MSDNPAAWIKAQLKPINRTQAKKARRAAREATKRPKVDYGRRVRQAPYDHPTPIMPVIPGSGPSPRKRGEA